MVFGWTTKVRARHSVRVSVFLAILALWLGGTPAVAASIEAVQIERDRIVITFDERIADATAFLLDGPHRIALDLAGVQPGALPRAAGPVASVRQAARGDATRIVFDLSRPTLIESGSFGKRGRSLILELRSVDASRFSAEAARGSVRFAPPASAPAKVAVTVPETRGGPPLPKVIGADDSRPLVVIDAGHGGHDPGAIANYKGLREKDLTLALARAIRDQLVKSGRVRVAMTRDDDRYLLHRERFGVARRLGADLFISVHCDSAGNPEATGATAYTLSEVASDKEAARLAARENKSDLIAGVNLGAEPSDISSILIDLTQRETMNRSASFARLLGREAQPLIPTKPSFHRMASLLVLKAPDMPSILFETGYVSNDNDAKFLASKEGQKKIGESVQRAVDIHFARRMASR
ncbi:N-acetylmuramoyl-L-alanine amidase [Sphingomonas japonica]|uniref:N-acetylmuramoyl-L-alanine amidase n=1 Tax=Sphingomonas japonica TaxID=511662 RepID=A0ABX0U3X0_9SPHN|nr:N-acetylmuramoyl-L-alanine amidase [Sphingomonas japonica]NIJ24037.1 N-acetylmuramoyl-L-alanine amidase [Sphingomonas japonica]